MTNEKRHLDILNIFAQLKKNFMLVERNVSEHSCMAHHLILKAYYPEAECWFNVDHVISKVGEKFYDRTGEVTETDNFRPITEYYDGEDLRFAVINMLMNQLPRECNPELQDPPSNVRVDRETFEGIARDIADIKNLLIK